MKTKELKIMLVEIKYCPICGKGLFWKKFIETTHNEDLFEFIEQDEKFPIYNYKCNKCKSKFKIEVRGELNPKSKLK